jgi:hypothetical protein
MNDAATQVENAGLLIGRLIALAEKNHDEHALLLLRDLDSAIEAALSRLSGRVTELEQAVAHIDAVAQMEPRGGAYKIRRACRRALAGSAGQEQA